MILATKGAIAHSGIVGLPYLWIIAGSSGTLKTSTSTTASSWTTQTSSFGSSQIYGVASNGTSLYVASGELGKIATSPDGINWTQRTSGLAPNTITQVAYGNGLWVACDAVGNTVTSTDGITWSAGASTAGLVYGLAYGNGLWACLRNDGTIRTTTDPTSSWTTRTSTLSGGRINGLYYAPDQSIWIAGNDTGTTGALASSSDGITWTSRNSAFSMISSGIGITSTASVVVIGATTSISPATCDVQSSTNGTTWTNQSPADSSEVIFSAAVDDAGFMIVAGTKIQSTTNGSTWTDQGTTGVANAFALCHSSGVPSIR